MSVPTLLELSEAERQTFERVCGPSGLASALAARSLKVPLLADDTLLRYIAYSRWDVTGASSQGWLIDAVRRNRLDAVAYHRAVAQLAMANYVFLSVVAQALLDTLREEEFRVTPKVVRVFQLLKGPESEEDSAIRVGLEFIRLLWLETGLLAHHRPLLLDLLMGALYAGRPRQRVLAKFRAGLPDSFPLTPQYVLEILRLLASTDVGRRVWPGSRR